LEIFKLSEQELVEKTISEGGRQITDLGNGKFIVIRFQNIPIMIQAQGESITYSTGENHEGRMAYEKKRMELLEHLESLESKAIIPFSEVQEIMYQQYVLEIRRAELFGHVGETVIVSNTELFFGKDLNEAVAKAKEKYGERPYYSETVNMLSYPSAFGQM
jgi:hypothetical protein